MQKRGFISTALAEKALRDVASGSNLAHLWTQKRAAELVAQAMTLDPAAPKGKVSRVAFHTLIASMFVQSQNSSALTTSVFGLALADDDAVPGASHFPPSPAAAAAAATAAMSASSPPPWAHVPLPALLLRLPTDVQVLIYGRLDFTSLRKMGRVRARGFQQSFGELCVSFARSYPCRVSLL